MRKVILAGLRAHKLRLLLTALSIVLGVGFLSGTLTYRDTAHAAFFDQFAHSARNVDVAVKAGKDPLPESALRTVRQVPGVSVADGTMTQTLPMLDRDGRLISNFGAAGIAESMTEHAALRDFTLASGKLPSGTGQAALDEATAKHARYRPGDTIVVLDAKQHKHSVLLTGTVRFGSGNADQSRLVLLPADIASLTGKHGYQQILATAADGVDPAELTAKVGAALGSGYTVETGDTLRTDLAADAVSQVDLFLTGIAIFGVIALVVSAFVIYNTFTILIAQRRRELALLRCVGASRAQVFASVVGESAVVGVLGSVVGLLFGAGLSYGIYAALGAIGLSLPAHSLVISAGTVAAGLALGVLVTVASAAIPAFGATRVAPVAALRADPDGGHPTRHRVVRAVLAVLIGGIGALVTVLGVGRDTASDPTTGLVFVAAGGLVVFLGLVILSPLFLGRLIALLGWLPGKLLGVPTRLATANARRNPSRVAATTTALMIGVALMTMFTVMLSTVRTVANDQVGAHFPADYQLSGTYNSQDAGIPGSAIEALRSRPELSDIASVWVERATIDGRRTSVSAVDSGGAQGILPPAKSGSLTRLGTGTVAVSATFATATHLALGDPITVSAKGKQHRYRVVATYDGGPLGAVLLSRPDFVAAYGTTPVTSVLVRAAPGVGPADSRAAVDAALRDYPLVQVSSMSETRTQLNDSLDSMLGIFAALLAISIIIALFGIANTLSLSVFERTRESALLRALGLTRGQLRAMLLAEALLMAIVGAFVGIVFGVVFGAAATAAAFSGIGGSLHVPVPQLLLYLALAAAAGMLAAVLPARRAARTSVVAAIAEA